MSGLPEADANKLMVTLLYMRHHEADFRVTESEVARQQFQWVEGYDKVRPLHAVAQVRRKRRATAHQIAEPHAQRHYQCGYCHGGAGAQLQLVDWGAASRGRWTVSPAS